MCSLWEPVEVSYFFEASSTVGAFRINHKHEVIRFVRLQGVPSHVIGHALSLHVCPDAGF
jgi:hypothetical protein